MPRPPLDSNLVLEIYRLRQEGKSIDKILDELAAVNADCISTYTGPARRTIAKYTRKYDGLPKRVKEFDNPFQWHHLESYGLPWESSVYILEALFYFEERYRNRSTLLFPSARRVIWWWRVHQAAPELSMDDVFFLAEHFTHREQLRELLEISTGMEDLESHLAYKPWLSENRRYVYLQAIEDGRIPPKKFSQEYVEGLRALSRTEYGEGFYFYLVPLDEKTGESLLDLTYSQNMHITQMLKDGSSMKEAVKSALKFYCDWDVSPI